MVVPHCTQWASCVCISRSVVSDSLWPQGLQPARLLVSMGFSRQDYWNVLPFPSPEDLPDPGIEPWYLALQADSLPFELQGSLNGHHRCWHLISDKIMSCLFCLPPLHVSDSEPPKKQANVQSTGEEMRRPKLWPCYLLATKLRTSPFTS